MSVLALCVRCSRPERHQRVSETPGDIIVTGIGLTQVFVHCAKNELRAALFVRVIKARSSSSINALACDKIQDSNAHHVVICRHKFGEQTQYTTLALLERSPESVGLDA